MATGRGRGAIRVASGLFSAGNFAGGKNSGQGMTLSPDGSYYVGGFKDGLPHGRGTWSNKWTAYSGDWANLTQHGRGTLWTADGSAMKGTFEDGAFKRGILRYAGEYVYEGAVDENYLPHGRGILISTAQSVIREGNFVRGRLHGYGRSLNPDRSTYVGGFKEGVMSGSGVLTFASGAKIVGNFAENVPIKQHVYVLPRGRGAASPATFKTKRINGIDRFVLFTYELPEGTVTTRWD